MARPDFNPPNIDCQACQEAGTSPSKTFYLGGRFVPDPPEPPEGPGAPGRSQHRWTCEHKHEWVVWDEPPPPTSWPRA